MIALGVSCGSLNYDPLFGTVRDYGGIIGKQCLSILLKIITAQLSDHISSVR